MKIGLYERLIDRHLESLLAAISPERVERVGLDEGESHSVLSQHIANILSTALASIRHEDRLEAQVTLCNQIIQIVAQHLPDHGAELSQIISGSQRSLYAVKPEAVAGIVPTLPRPDTPLSLSCLLTGTRVDPSLVSQLRAELKTADRVDILCSFIKWSGIRVLEEEFRTFTQRPQSRLRVITTSYMGATDVRAVEFLRSLPHTEVKVSFDTRRTRLHAKAYAFHRETGFGTAYVGSSNLSHAALTDGLEWNVKISQYESAHLWQKTEATFETYWNDTEFVLYREEDRERLSAALAQERSGESQEVSFFFEIQAYPYQQAILDKLEAERTYQNRWRNLVVAATGTGKTVIAALDYRRFRQQCLRDGQPSRLLFIAHRREILEQSLACFRAVLRDANFGELLVGSHAARDRQNLFASIQSYNSKKLWQDTTSDFYDYVVIDETHRIGAESLYQDLLAHIKPRILLGLTATPERTGGQSILSAFDGHVSAEIRLPTAINRKLLSPFQYFGITDSVDLSQLAWRRGGYAIDELEALYTGNEARADLIVRKVHEILLDARQARGVGFCVSVAHAQYMAAYFQKAGLSALALSAQSTEEERTTARQKLIARTVNFIFVVDLYNEGIDIPELDTVLFLRPTESLTVFLQQLGRGLRLHPEKDCLTVLDFIGQAHRSYNFEIRFRSLMDRPQRRLDREIETGTMPLPAGCTITLEKLAQRRILDNIQRALSGHSAGLIQRLQSFSNDTGQPLTLAGFLNFHEMEPEGLYRYGTWTQLCARSGLGSDVHDPDAVLLQKGFRRVAHLSGPQQIQRLREILASDVPASSLGAQDQKFILMLHTSLWRSWQPASLGESLTRIRQNPQHRSEISELLAYRYDYLSSVSPKLSLPFPCPLELHAAYTRDEILMGLGFWTLREQPAFREGVKYLPDLPADLFFVTLNKTEREYSPTTMYADYAISEHLFHWQSQSTASETSETGQRYQHHASRGHTLLLFVREEKMKNSLAQPYQFLGPVKYRSHIGSRPMSIELELAHAIPARLLPSTRRLAIN